MSAWMRSFRPEARTATLLCERVGDRLTAILTTFLRKEKRNEPKHNYHFRDEDDLSSAVDFSWRSVVAICSASHVNVIGKVLSANGRTRSPATTRQRTMRSVRRAADNSREKVRMGPCRQL
jgi:hypothetical protein